MYLNHWNKSSNVQRSETKQAQIKLKMLISTKKYDKDSIQGQKQLICQYYLSEHFHIQFLQFWNHIFKECPKCSSFVCFFSVLIFNIQINKTGQHIDIYDMLSPEVNIQGLSTSQNMSEDRTFCGVWGSEWWQRGGWQITCWARQLSGTEFGYRFLMVYSNGFAVSI